MDLTSSIDMAPSLPLLGLALFFVLLVLHYTRQYRRLSHIPGPFLARFSNLPRLYWVYRRDAHNVHIAQHRGTASPGRDGTKGTGTSWAPLVRYGPKAVSVGSAAAVDTVYRMRGGPAAQVGRLQRDPAMRSGVILPTIFAAQDEALHRMLKRPIAAVYSMSNLSRSSRSWTAPSTFSVGSLTAAL